MHRLKALASFFSCGEVYFDCDLAVMAVQGKPKKHRFRQDLCVRLSLTDGAYQKPSIVLLQSFTASRCCGAPLQGCHHAGEHPVFQGRHIRFSALFSDATRMSFPLPIGVGRNHISGFKRLWKRTGGLNSDLRLGRPAHHRNACAPCTRGSPGMLLVYGFSSAPLNRSAASTSCGIRGI